MRRALVGGSSRRLRTRRAGRRLCRRHRGRKQNRPHHHPAARSPPPRCTESALRRTQLAGLPRRQRLRCCLRIRQAQRRLCCFGRLLPPQPSQRFPRCEALRPALLERGKLPAPAAVQQPSWELHRLQLVARPGRLAVGEVTRQLLPRHGFHAERSGAVSQVERPSCTPGTRARSSCARAAGKVPVSYAKLNIRRTCVSAHDAGGQPLEGLQRRRSRQKAA